MILQLTSWTVSWMVRDLELQWSSTSVSYASLPLSSVPVDEDSMEPFLLMAKQALLAATSRFLWVFEANGLTVLAHGETAQALGSLIP